MIKYAAILLAILTSLIFSTEIFKVKSVQISQSDCVRPEDINLKGKIIFSISPDQLKKDLQSKFPCVSEVNLEKIYPNTINLDITANGPVAKIANTNYALALNGKIIEADPQVQLAVLYLPADANHQDGKIEDQHSLFAIKIAYLLARTDFRLSAIRVLDQEIVAYDAKEVTAHFSPQKDANVQVDSLQQTVATAKIDGDKIAKIDLRFDKPVITFK